MVPNGARSSATLQSMLLDSSLNATTSLSPPLLLAGNVLRRLPGTSPMAIFRSRKNVLIDVCATANDVNSVCKNLVVSVVGAAAVPVAKDEDIDGDGSHVNSVSTCRKRRRVDDMLLACARSSG